MDAYEIIYEHYIAPFQNKRGKKKLLGLELEFPVRKLQNKKIVRREENNDEEKKKLKSILEKQMNQDFAAAEFSSDGYCIRAKNHAGTAMSFDSSYLNFEFSLVPAKSLNQVSQMFWPVFKKIQSSYEELGYEMAGSGLNYYAIREKDSLPISRRHNSPCYMEEQFLKQYQKETDPLFQIHPNFFTIISSIQTHFDCDIQDLPRLLNAMNRLDFINHLLFDNSLYQFYGKWYLSGRYFLYRKSGFTDLGLTGGSDEIYSNIEDIIKDYANRRLACQIRNGEPAFFSPVSWEEYYHSSEKKPERSDICQIFSYKNSELSRFGTIEHRIMDTQPLCDSLLPSAWMYGLLNCLDETEEELGRIERDLFPGYGNTRLGDMAICADMHRFFLEKGMEERLARLYEIAQKGLGQNDRCFLLGLEDRIGGLQSPAMKELDNWRKGVGRISGLAERV